MGHSYLIVGSDGFDLHWFHTGEEVATYLLGRDITKHVIIKRGVGQVILISPEYHKIETQLDAAKREEFTS